MVKKWGLKVRLDAKNLSKPTTFYQICLFLKGFWALGHWLRPFESSFVFISTFHPWMTFTDEKVTYHFSIYDTFIHGSDFFIYWWFWSMDEIFSSMNGIKDDSWRTWTEPLKHDDPHCKHFIYRIWREEVITIKKQLLAISANICCFWNSSL